MLQDRVLIFDDEGNASTRRAISAPASAISPTLTLDAPLAKIGLKGLRVKFDGTLQRTRVDDPITGEPRNWSATSSPTGSGTIDVRHDIGKCSYGFTVNDRERFTFFRTDEFDTNFNGGPYGNGLRRISADARGTTITLDLDNAVRHVAATATGCCSGPTGRDPRRRDRRVPRAQPPPATSA